MTYKKDDLIGATANSYEESKQEYLNFKKWQITSLSHPVLFEYYELFCLHQYILVREGKYADARDIEATKEIYKHELLTRMQRKDK